jgi:hypothetical protein
MQTTIITLYSLWQHARNYYNPKQQRQVLRILGMPAVYGSTSLFLLPPLSRTSSLTVPYV